jgi:hypothetical protein
MELAFRGPLWFWRGPAPWYFLVVPEAECAVLEAVSPALSYGWGCIPVRAQVGDTEWTTSLMPKDGGYLVPVKAAVRAAEQLGADDTIAVRLILDT